MEKGVLLLFVKFLVNDLATADSISISALPTNWSKVQ